ncbi:MAG: hypothetical protein IPG63_13820 [Xanthomonadales bacterium]|nr:hypothetical protein [Xanthomonadales bacterium]MBK7146907.1 hypothetical protein [Xanthomonadales bacterium]MCC6559953.1 hypothetical protein [Xanthomonadales bacterium]
MASPQAFNELARAMHHARFGEALALIDALLAQMPESSSLRRQRLQCEAALARGAEAEREAQALAVAIEAPELIRVDAALFNVEQQMHCKAAAAELGALGLLPLVDAASPAFSKLSQAPVLIRFYGDDSGDAVVVCFAAVLRQLPARLLACVSAFDDGSFVLTHRDGELAIASTDQVAICTLPQHASLAELVTRHAGQRAIRLRAKPGLGLLALRTLSDCDRVWRMVAGS